MRKSKLHQKLLWCNCSGIQSTQALISYLEPCPKGKSNVVWWPNIFPFWHHVWSCWIVIVSHKDTRSSTLSNIEYLWYCLATHCTTFDYIWLPTFSHLETSGKECFSLFISGGLQPLGRLLPKLLFHSSALFLPCYTKLFSVFYHFFSHNNDFWGTIISYLIKKHWPVTQGIHNSERSKIFHKFKTLCWQHSLDADTLNSNERVSITFCQSGVCIHNGQRYLIQHCTSYNTVPSVRVYNYRYLMSDHYIQ